MGFPLDFLAGAVAIISGPKIQVPLVIGTAAWKVVTGLKNRKRGEPLAETPNGGERESNGSKPEPVTLSWQNVTCTLSDSKTGATRELLSLDGGCATPGRLLAIMGPSGSGKTTLLNALAGQLPRSAALQLRGTLIVNGVSMENSHHRQGYVQQEDIFFSQLTVKETLMMAAHLRLPESQSDADKETYVDSLIARLGMTKAAHTIVGDAKVRGLSGGEKKRLAIGCELVASPSLLFADEPTSGLDSFQAQKVMQTLKELGGEGHTVVCSIHQPRSSIFELFDDLLLLSEGEVVYSGPAADVADYFASLGHPCPQYHNPAEFLADLISIDTSSPEVEAETRLRLKELVAAHQQLPAMMAPVEGTSTALTGSSAANGQQESTATCGWPKQVRLLFSRSWKQVSRDKFTNLSRAGVNISSALIFGSIFWRMRRSQSNIADRMGLLQVVAVNTAMSSLVKTLNVFPRERTIVTRERSKKAYSVLPYFGSKLVAELPVGALFPLLFGAMVYPMTGLNPSPKRFLKFLAVLTLESFVSASLGLAVGSVAPSTEAAVAIGPAVMVIFIVFGGVYVSADNVPSYLKWLPRTSMIKYAYEGLCVNEFRGMEFETTGASGDLATGDQVLQRMSYGNSSLWKTLQGQGRVLLFNYWLTYCVLKAKKPRFQPLLPPADQHFNLSIEAPEFVPESVANSAQLDSTVIEEDSAGIVKGRNGNGGNGTTTEKAQRN